MLALSPFYAKCAYPDISNYRARPSRFCAIHSRNAVIETTQMNRRLEQGTGVLNKGISVEITTILSYMT